MKLDSHISFNVLQGCTYIFAIILVNIIVIIMCVNVCELSVCLSMSNGSFGATVQGAKYFIIRKYTSKTAIPKLCNSEGTLLL